MTEDEALVASHSQAFYLGICKERLSCFVFERKEEPFYVSKAGFGGQVPVDFFVQEIKEYGMFCDVQEHSKSFVFHLSKRPILKIVK